MTRKLMDVDVDLPFNTHMHNCLVAFKVSKSEFVPEKLSKSCKILYSVTKVKKRPKHASFLLNVTVS